MSKNNEVVKRPIGRPPAYDDPIIFETKCNEYFDLMDETEKPYTISGLCCHLKIGKDCFYDYTNREGYSESIKHARQRIENYTESYLFSGKNPAGAIFSLKNNYGWIDKVETINTNTNTNTAQIDLSGFSIDELKQLIASTEQKLIEADYTATDE